MSMSHWKWERSICYCFWASDSNRREWKGTWGLHRHNFPGTCLFPFYSPWVLPRNLPSLPSCSSCWLWSPCTQVLLPMKACLVWVSYHSLATHTIPHSERGKSQGQMQTACQDSVWQSFCPQHSLPLPLCVCVYDRSSNPPSWHQ